MRDFFSAFGKIIDATVMVDRESGRSKGFGFVTFEDATNSDQFVGKLGLTLDDKQASDFVVRRTRAPANHCMYAPPQIEVKTAQPRSQRDQARNLPGNREPYFNDQDSRTPPIPSVPFSAQQAGNPAASMLYQRMMNQVPPMSNATGVNMMNPMMMGMMGMGGMGGMAGMNSMGGNMPGMNGMGGMGMNGMGMMGGGMGPMGGMNPMAMRMGMNAPMGMGMMGQPGAAMGMGNMGMRMRPGMGMGMGGGPMGGGAGMGVNGGRMAMNTSLGPSRMSTRGQHAFHPYAR